MLESLIRFLFPPKLGATDHELWAWRLAVMSFLVGGLLISAAHMAWTVGSLPWFEDEGFVDVKLFEQLAADTRAARQNTLQVSIMDTHRRACKAKGDYFINLIDQRTKLLIEWKKITDTSFPPLPDCDEMEE